MKKMKKIMSLMLSVVMLLSVTAGVGFSAQAAVATLLWPVYDSSGNPYKNLNSHNADNTSGHQGIDINAPLGAKWYAPCNATVDTLYTGCKTNANGNHASCSPNHGRWGAPNGKKICNDGFGNGVLLKCSFGGTTYYIHCAHMSSVSSSLKVGQSISQGTYIGTVGDRGYSYGAHAHFQIVKGNNKWAKNTCCNDPTHSHCAFSYKYNGSSSTQKSPSVSVKGASSITNSSARIDFTANNPSRVTIKTVGVQIRKKGDSSWKTKSEAMNSSYVNASSVPMWWTVGSGKEVNMALSSGTTYEYRAYVVYNGNNYYSSTASFTTSGSHTHSWGSGTVVQSPTCYAPGFRKYTCSGCGAIKTESINKTSHNFVLDSQGNSNCLNPGKKTYICTTCGYTKTEDIPAKEHKFSEWKTYKEATCEEDGEQKRMCTVCGFEEVKKVPAGHKFEDGYCTICGAEEDKLDDNYYDDDELTTPPARVTVKKLKSKKRTVIAYWGKISDARGYQIQLSTNKKFKKNKKTFSIENQKASKKTINNLKAKKKYYVRVRAYRYSYFGDGEKIYGKWSKVKSVKTK